MQRRSQCKDKKSETFFDKNRQQYEEFKKRVINMVGPKIFQSLNINLKNKKLNITVCRHGIGER